MRLNLSQGELPLFCAPATRRGTRIRCGNSQLPCGREVGEAAARKEKGIKLAPTTCREKSFMLSGDACSFWRQRRGSGGQAICAQLDCFAFLQLTRCDFAFESTARRLCDPMRRDQRKHRKHLILASSSITLGLLVELHTRHRREARRDRQKGPCNARCDERSARSSGR